MTFDPVHIDQQATLALNSLHTAAGDHFWLMMSDHKVWIPFYLTLIFIILRRLGWRRGLILVAACLVAFALSDQLSTLVKRSVERLRPCYTTWMLENGLHTPEGRGGYFGFFSSHASNAFMLIACILTGLRADPACRHKDIALIGYTWASLVAFSRIMMGKHYLGDVLTGIVFGWMVGWLCGLAARWVMQITDGSRRRNSGRRVPRPVHPSA
jgi:undecaprenyl-diphosphatase